MAENETETGAVTTYANNPGPLRLQGAVQHYEWGGFTFIPNLLGVENGAKEPFAELWMGANTGAPSVADLGGLEVPLDRLMDAAPEAVLGSADAARFHGKLPYLFKVLDARNMLSIQAHPTKEQAEEGFARENAAGVPLKDPHRNYKDDNHKPEQHVALTDFWMLHGFRPLDEMADALNAVREFAPLASDFRTALRVAGHDEDARKAALRALYERVMTMPQETVDGYLNPLIARLEANKPADKDAPDFWALRASENFPLADGHRDRGIFSIYMLNLVHLKPGQGTYQPAGMLHAYLEGTNMELMANSDNVLRGGLTPKHVDVPELMDILTFEYGPSHVLEGKAVSPTERIYRTPATEFVLGRITLTPGQTHQSDAGHGADVLIVLEGAATLSAADQTLNMERGQIILAPAGVPYTLAARNAPSTLFRAAVPAAA